MGRRAGGLVRDLFGDFRVAVKAGLSRAVAGSLLSVASFRHFRGTEPPRFAHSSELELAELLDASGIAWLYEPHTFPLELSADGAVLEAFTPDFFLPDAGVYVECTTAHPSLLSRKRRKIRKASESHGLVITLHRREDFERLRRKYRAGP
jgi:hypothetical protein